MIPDARDIPLTDLERNILSELRAVAARIPADTNPSVSATRQHGRTTHRRTVGSGIVAAGIAVTVAGGGYAAGAAAGVLPNPWSGPAALNNGFVTSPNPAGTVELAVPGPESTTLEIVADNVTVGGVTEECTGVVIKESQGRSVHPMSECGGASAIRAENGVFDWQAPSGATFAIISGQAPAGATTAAVIDRTGTVTTEPVAGGYFVTYVSAQAMPVHGIVDFYNSTGQLVGSQNFAAQ